MIRFSFLLCVGLVAVLTVACGPQVHDSGGWTDAHWNPTLTCIRRIESGGDGYGASNGSHFGAYQYSQSLWTSQANGAGYPQYANTRPLWAGAHGEFNVPPWVQDEVAFYTLFDDRSAWREC